MRDYAQEVEIPFVRKAISAIGRIAIKVQGAADRCVHVLLELTQSKIDYVIQEIIIVMKDIIRRHPGKYEGIIVRLCDNLKNLDNAEARASMVWILGEYGHRIDNAIDLLQIFAENFKEEPKKVQLAILTSSVKLYLKLEDAAEELVTEIIRLSTDESDNPDLRNRGYIYWRMLHENPEKAKQIILAERPPISEDSKVGGSNIEPVVLEKMLDNVGMLASVYCMPPEKFVKKIRDKINERFDLENDEVTGSTQEEYVDSTGVAKSAYVQESQQQNVQSY